MRSNVTPSAYKAGTSWRWHQFSVLTPAASWWCRSKARCSRWSPLPELSRISDVPAWWGFCHEGCRFLLEKSSAIQIFQPIRSSGASCSTWVQWEVPELDECAEFLLSLWSGILKKLETASRLENIAIRFFFPGAMVWVYQIHLDTAHLTLLHSACRGRANAAGPHWINREWTPLQDMSQWVFLLWSFWTFCFGLPSVAKEPGLSVMVGVLTSQGSAPKVAPPLDQLQLSTSLCWRKCDFSSPNSFWLRSSGQSAGWGVCSVDWLLIADPSDTHNSHRSGWKDHCPCNTLVSPRYCQRTLLVLGYPWLSP